MKNEGRSLILTTHQLDEAEILQMVIDLPFQKNGYGFLLLNEIVDILDKENIQQIFLEVRVGNDGAIKLYDKLGFNIIGKRKNYYTINAQKYDALLMAYTNQNIFASN